MCAKCSLISRSDCADSIFPITLQHAQKGTDDGTKTNEFSEKFQTAFDPQPPTFSENHAAILSQRHPKKTCLRVQNLQQFFLDWKCPSSPLPHRNFSENHPFWYRQPSLRMHSVSCCLCISLYISMCVWLMSDECDVHRLLSSLLTNQRVKSYMGTKRVSVYICAVYVFYKINAKKCVKKRPLCFARLHVLPVSVQNWLKFGTALPSFNVCSWLNDYDTGRFLINAAAESARNLLHNITAASLLWEHTIF